MPFWDHLETYLEEKGVEYNFRMGGEQYDTAWVVELDNVPRRVVDDLLVPAIRIMAREDFFYVNNVVYNDPRTTIYISFGTKKWK